MQRAESPAFLESIANDPRVRPFIGPGTHPVVAGETWKRSIGLEWETGGIVFMQVSEGVYGAHFLFLPGTPDTFGKYREALHYLFTRTDAGEVIGDTPKENAKARRVAAFAGMKFKGLRDGQAHYALTAREWEHARKRS